MAGVVDQAADPCGAGVGSPTPDMGVAVGVSLDKAVGNPALV
jgi:hypothetical protein